MSKRTVTTSSAGKKPACTVMKVDLLALKGLFEVYDKNGDGFISLEEINAESRRNLDRVRPDPQSKLRRQLAHYSDSLHKSILTAFDSDGDGRFNFRDAMRYIWPGLSAEQEHAMVRFAYPETPPLQAPRTTPTAQQEDEIKAIFVLYDKDANGGLDTRELAAALPSFGHTEIELLHEEFDVDHSGAIELGEFRDIMLSSGLYGPDLRGEAKAGA